MDAEQAKAWRRFCRFWTALALRAASDPGAREVVVRVASDA